MMGIRSKGAGWWMGGLALFAVSCSPAVHGRAYYGLDRPVHLRASQAVAILEERLPEVVMLDQRESRFEVSQEEVRFQLESAPRSGGLEEPGVWCVRVSGVRGVGTEVGERYHQVRLVLDPEGFCGSGVAQDGIEECACPRGGEAAGCVSTVLRFRSEETAYRVMDALLVLAPGAELGTGEGEGAESGEEGCALNSDCPEGWYCAEGSCHQDCREDRDCRLGEGCDERNGRCVERSIEADR